MKKFTLWILLLGSVTISKAQSDKLIGNWEFTSNGQTSRLQIASQNKLIFDGETCSYVLINNALRVKDGDGYLFDYQYVLQGDQLLLTFPDGYQYPFQKAKDSPPPDRNTTSASSSTQALYGKLCSFSSSSGGGSSYSSTRTFYFDGKGKYGYSTDNSYSGSNGGYYSNDPNAITGEYKVEGNTLTLYIDGSIAQTLEVNMVQTSGEITELRMGQTYYGKNICE